VDGTGSRSPARVRFRINCIKNSGFSNTDSICMLLQIAGPDTELPGVTSGVGKLRLSLQDGEEETREQQKVMTEGENM
jgi:hypothetical protein